MKKIRVGISCIGSGVGQSVIDSCNLSKLPLYTVGFGTNPLAFGLYECDDFAYTKSFYDDEYIPNIIQHCIDKEIDVFFPGHDDDAHIIAKNIEQFENNNIKVVVSGVDLFDLCRDKEQMSFELNKISNIFVQSFDYNSFLKAYQNNEISLPVIAKPRDGYASRGIEIIQTESDFYRINKNLIVQELAVPGKNDIQREYFDKKISQCVNPQIAEISIQLVADKHGDLMGQMISYNKLKSGVPIEIIPFQNDDVWKQIDKLYETFKDLGLRGPLNLQGRLTDNGLKLFDMNARFTGITGLRAYMGFNEVELCIKEWMGIRGKSENLKFNYRRFGIRQVANKSLSFHLNNDVLELSKKINNKQIFSKKNILITGATGFIGQNLIKKLVTESSDYNIWAFTRNKQKATNLFSNSNITIYDNKDLETGVLSMGNVDTLLHLGFARPHCTKKEIAESLNFTTNLFTQAVNNQVAEIINVSSQSVYGQSNTPPWHEDTQPAPDLAYSQAKYATELLLNSLAKLNPHIKITSLRLAAISGGAKGAVIQDLPSKLVSQALNGEVIKVFGGQQSFEFIDIHDAVDAIFLFLGTDSRKWEQAYNLGSGQTNALDEIVTIIAQKVNKALNKKLQIEKNESSNIMHFGMDSSRFKEITGWVPSKNIENITDSLVDYWHKKRK